MDESIDPAVAEALATTLFGAIVAADVDTIRADVYAPDVEVWHNNDDGPAQDLDANLRTLRWLTRTVTDLRYDEVRRQPTPTGFVQQHVLRATGPGGVAVEIPACLVVTVRGDRISRIDEYIDSAHLAPLLP